MQLEPTFRVLVSFLPVDRVIVEKVLGRLFERDAAHSRVDGDPLLDVAFAVSQHAARDGFFRGASALSNGAAVLVVLDPDRRQFADGAVQHFLFASIEAAHSSLPFYLSRSATGTL